MPIRELHTDSLQQQCASCRGLHTISFDALTVGIKNNRQVHAHGIAMPPCAHCGAREFVFPSKPDISPHPVSGSYGHRHRLLVDELTAILVRHGRFLQEAAADIGSSRPLSRRDRKRWFPNGLRLPVPSTEKDDPR